MWQSGISDHWGPLRGLWNTYTMKRGSFINRRSHLKSRPRWAFLRHIRLKGFFFFLMYVNRIVLRPFSEMYALHHSVSIYPFIGISRSLPRGFQSCTSACLSPNQFLPESCLALFCISASPKLHYHFYHQCTSRLPASWLLCVHSCPPVMWCEVFPPGASMALLRCESDHTVYWL